MVCQWYLLCMYHKSIGNYSKLLVDISSLTWILRSNKYTVIIAILFLLCMHAPKLSGCLKARPHILFIIPSSLVMPCLLYRKKEGGWPLSIGCIRPTSSCCYITLHIARWLAIWHLCLLPPPITMIPGQSGSRVKLQFMQKGTSSTTSCQTSLW